MKSDFTVQERFTTASQERRLVETNIPE